MPPFKYKVVSAKEAPPATKNNREVGVETRRFLRALKPGEVAIIEMESVLRPKETASHALERMRTTLRYHAVKLGFEVSIWRADDVLCVQKLKEE